MLFKRPFLDGIVSGEITAAFRRWTRLTVRAGGTLKTAVGVLGACRETPRGGGR